MRSIDEQIEKISQGILATIRATDFREVSSARDIIQVFAFDGMQRAQRNLSKVWTRLNPV